MTDTSDLVEVLAWITEHVDEIPQHRRRQALLTLERVERLVPLRDADVDALETTNTDTQGHPDD